MLDDDGDPDAYVWALEIAPGVFDFHAVSHPFSRGRWLTPRRIKQMLRAVKDYIQPPIAMAQIHSEEHKRIWRFFGMTVLGPIAIRYFEDFYHGNVQDAQAPGAAPGTEGTIEGSV